MRRFAHCLILLLAPCSAAWAEDVFEKSQRGACVYSSDSPSRTSTPTPPYRQASALQSPLPRYTRPAVEQTGHGGGGSEDDLMQRMRAPRWHSFLPGMFR